MVHGPRRCEKAWRLGWWVGTEAHAGGLLHWPQDGSSETDTPGVWTRRQAVRRRAGKEQAGRPLGHSWWPPLESGHGTKHDQQPLTAGWTGWTRAEGQAPGIGCLRRWFRSGGRRGGCVPRQAALEVVQERTMDWTPQAIVADFVETRRPHRLENAPDELVYHQHGLERLQPGHQGRDARLITGHCPCLTAGTRPHPGTYTRWEKSRAAAPAMEFS